MRAWIYDKAVVWLTKSWYAAVIDRVADGAKILDVGVGTGGALVANAEGVKAKGLQILGVDIDADYINTCRQRVAEANLSEHVEVRQVSILDVEDSGFDAIYFSASFMLMPNPSAVLAHVITLLTDGGKVYFTQTFEGKKSKFAETVKPMLHKITTIQFGAVTYEAEFEKFLEGERLEVLENVRLTGNDKRSGHLVVGRPRPA